MKIVCLGGGPAGVYLAISMKLHNPAHAVSVYERNKPDDTFGWGVVFSDQTRKWSFVDKDGNRISLTLQHNAMDSEEKLGNAIKLTMTNLIEEDQRCYADKGLDQLEKLRQGEGKTMTTGLTGWNLYIPR